MKPNEKSNDVLINDFAEYKHFIMQVYKCGWDKSTDEQIIETFGNSKYYPVVITLQRNSLDAYNNTQLHFVYIRKFATAYRESYYN